MWGYIGAAIATVIVVVLIVAALKPGHFQIQRSAMIGAPPAVIYGYIADFRKWTQWSPWERIDPNLRRTYSGADHGVGAVYAWDSNNSKAGAGRMEITKAAENTLINLDLDFIKPFRASNKVAFAFSPEADGTLVLWTMTGPLPFMAKLMHTLMNMDKMVGKDFEAGLATLKSISETAARA